MSEETEKDKFCARCGCEIEVEDLRCILCGMATPFAREIPEKKNIKILRCENCGAAVSYSAKHQAPSCGFCNSVMKVEQPEDPIEEAEEFLLFEVPEKTARSAFNHWLANLGFFRPSDLLTEASIKNLKPLWWAAWVVKADVLVSWTTDTDRDSKRARWAPAAGQTPLEFQNLLISASRGLTISEVNQIAPYYRIRSVTDNPESPEQAIVESYDVQRSAARKIVTGTLEMTAYHRIKNEYLPGHRHRHTHMELQLQELHTRRIALPAYILAYNYKGKTYRTIVNGQDAENVIGSAPYSIAKIALTITAGLTALLIIFILIIVFAN